MGHARKHLKNKVERN
jgi:hypothetical protein